MRRSWKGSMANSWRPALPGALRLPGLQKLSHLFRHAPQCGGLSALQHAANAAAVDFFDGRRQHLRSIGLYETHAEMHFTGGRARGMNRGQADAVALEH